MLCRLAGLSLLALVLIASPSSANPPKLTPAQIGNLLPLLDARSPEALAGVLRKVFLEALPSPLYESSQNWGHTTMVPNGVHWKKRGLLLRPEVVKAPRNDGTWKKIRVDVLHPRDSLVLDIRDVEFSEGTQMTFGVFLAFDARANYEHFVWESGVRLWSGSVKARFRVKLNLKCAAAMRLEAGQTFVPDAVFRMHATHANLTYENLVVEHVPGIGGTTARLIGEGAQETIRLLRPRLERQMLDKGNAAIVRAVDTKDVRVSLGNIFSKSMEQLKSTIEGK